MKTNRLILCAFLLAALLGQGCGSRKAPVSVEQPPVVSSSGSISESDLGVPLYPNSVPDQNQSFTFRGDANASSPVKTISVSLLTSDSVEQVKNFYRDKLGKKVQIQEHGSGSGTLVDMSFKDSKRQVRIQAVPQAGRNGSVIVILTQVRS